MARKIDTIVLHWSASAFGSVMLIDEWHRARSFKMIGYHFVILNGYITGTDFKTGRYVRRLDGALQVARPVDGDPFLDAAEAGAHAAAMGFNSHSLGVCMVATTEKPVTSLQLTACYETCLWLCDRYDIPHANVIGHKEIDPAKPLCPGVDMERFRRSLPHAFLRQNHIHETWNTETQNKEPTHAVENPRV